jgi:hypothetical protein
MQRSQTVNEQKTGAGANLFLPADAQLPQLDRELHELAQGFSAKAATARLSARRARERGNLVQWRKANAVAAAYNDARRALWGLACPF